MESKLNVELLNYSDDGLIIAMAGKLCYSSSGIEDLRKKITHKNTEDMIAKLADLGHLSTFEHITYTFGIEGVSRALTHQLVRHRIASYSQQSQRYVKEEQFDYIIPNTIKDSGFTKDFEEKMKLIQQWYSEMIEAGIPAEDARYYLPNAAETKIIVTMNARELLHFFNKRLCNRAQWEIREMAEEMYKLVKERTPIIFSNAGPHCIELGYCPEGNKTCKQFNEMKIKYGKGI